MLVAVLTFAQAEEKCEDIVCPYNYTPVCAKPLSGGGKPATFGNECGVRAYECQSKTSAYWKSLEFSFNNFTLKSF